VAKTVGAAALALGAGMLLSALDRFAIGWQVYLVVCTALPLAGLIFGISVTHRRSLDLYRPGTPSKLVIANETLFLGFNSHYFKSELRQLTGIHRILGFAVLVYENQTVLLVPWRVLPETARS